MWPKSAFDFLAPFLLSRNQRFAGRYFGLKTPILCSIESSDGAVPLEPDDGDRAVEAPRHHALPPHRDHGDGPRVCAHHGAALHDTAAVLNSAVND